MRTMDVVEVALEGIRERVKDRLVSATLEYVSEADLFDAVIVEVQDEVLERAETRLRPLTHLFGGKGP